MRAIWLDRKTAAAQASSKMGDSVATRGEALASAYDPLKDTVPIWVDPAATMALGSAPRQ